MHIGKLLQDTRIDDVKRYKNEPPKNYTHQTRRITGKCG